MPSSEPASEEARWRTRPRYVWHHRMHEDFAQERMAFVQLKFEPTYHRDWALQQLRSAFRETHVVSYTVWELFGDVDLLIRLWLPPSLSMKELTRGLDEALSGPYRARRS